MNGVLPWIGGKSLSAQRIVARMEPHVCYVEVFSGSAKVFFRKIPSRVEVLNDLDGELMNFYRCVQTAPERLARIIGAMPHSRALYTRLRREKPPEGHFYRRAARFWYLQSFAFGGKVRGQSFGVAKTRPVRGHPAWIKRSLREAAERLHRVTLECLPWQDVLRRYDGPDTLFYLDPPYVDMPFYNHNFAEADHRALGEVLRQIKGRFLLSYNDHVLVRETYGWARVEALDVRHGITHERGNELLISGGLTP